jgi:cell division protein ZapA
MKVVRVEILGMTYPIRVEGGKEEKYIQRLARYVDGKMRGVAPAGSQVLSVKLAVKTALNIADELHRLIKNRELADKKRSTRYQKLIKLLDEGLE